MLPTPSHAPNTFNSEFLFCSTPVFCRERHVIFEWFLSTAAWFIVKAKTKCMGLTETFRAHHTKTGFHPVKPHPGIELEAKHLGYHVSCSQKSQEKYLPLPTVYFFMEAFWAPQRHEFQTKSITSALRASSPPFSLLMATIMKLETSRQSSPSISLFLTPTPYRDLTFWLLTISVFLSPCFHCHHSAPTACFNTEF